ncbi:MAG: hypothetical protein KKH29_04610 [Candidatus Omnitrophica bacterium]|nr:hypothetical protein [Candidatus Omnitrophota bacterium]MBU4472570.1 hypothetical protein [Candidatus Omnitrophota bacterium]MCG2705962.1 hypothetical protein [Candidatus Omnitrophota bacterium]
MIEKTQIETFYKDNKYTVEEVAKKLNVSFWTVYNLMKRYNINRRDRSEAGYNYYKIKPQFEIKSNLSIIEEKLKIAGIMLYWAEGTLIGSTVDFANSNPKIIKIFLKFLREVCGICEERLKIYLYGYSFQDIEESKAYWHNITKVPLCQFTKPYIREGNSNLSNRKLPYGLIHVRYNDKRLLELIKNWIDEYINWAGGGVANRTRLWKNAASCRKTRWKSG